MRQFIPACSAAFYSSQWLFHLIVPPSCHHPPVGMVERCMTNRWAALLLLALGSRSHIPGLWVCELGWPITHWLYCSCGPEDCLVNSVTWYQFLICGFAAQKKRWLGCSGHRPKGCSGRDHVGTSGGWHSVPRVFLKHTFFLSSFFFFPSDWTSFFNGNMLNHVLFFSFVSKHENSDVSLVC